MYKAALFVHHVHFLTTATPTSRLVDPSCIWSPGPFYSICCLGVATIWNLKQYGLQMIKYSGLDKDLDFRKLTRFTKLLNSRGGRQTGNGYLPGSR